MRLVVAYVSCCSLSRYITSFLKESLRLKLSVVQAFRSTEAMAFREEKGCAIFDIQ